MPESDRTVRIPSVLPLHASSPDHAARTGGKATGLHALISLDLPVPAGFAISAQCYLAVIEQTGMDTKIATVLGSELDDEAKSQRILELFTEVRMPDDLAAEILAAYEAMGGGPVAVRSSGIAEDTAAASFAGQHDTYLWIEGPEPLLAHVLRCWASLYNAGAIGYRARFDIPVDQVAMAVVVQKMVQARAAGVMMTLEPVTGDGRQIYIEAAHGLGEGVVVGDVASDQLWFDKASVELVRSSINVQTHQHMFDPSLGGVTLQDLHPDVGSSPALSDAEAAEVARLGRDIESAFGQPMDIEWALDESGTVWLLQARPETVWSNRSETADGSSPTHGDLDPEKYYTTSNIGEAAPGVLSPLTWSVWGPAAEVAARHGFIKMGVLEASLKDEPVDPHDRFIQIAYGRAVISVSGFYEMGERIPGASGDLLVSSFLGRVPAGMRPMPTKRRYLHVAWTMPWAFISTPRELAAEHASVAAWWPKEIARTPHLDLAGARAQFAAAAQLFVRATSLQGQANVVAVPPVHQALEALVKSVGMEDRMGALTAGAGDHAETEVVVDLWELGRGRLSEEEFLRRHGFHGTREGDIAGRVWREDPTPIRRLAAMYAEQDESKDPRVTAAERASERQAAVAELLRRCSPLGRVKARIILSLAERRMPLRGLGKATFLRSLDVTRAAARRIGELLAAADRIDEVDDVMYLTAEELTAEVLPADVRDLIRARKAEQARYRTYEIPTEFWGEPPTVEATRVSDASSADRLEGLGASAGTVEGIARVVSDPAFSDVEPGEILVAATTDPSWAAVMLICSALVVDIGGALSHAAVVARELGIPCVVNTKKGTSAIRTGDRVRVDGRSGLVEILDRSPAPTQQESAS